MYIFHGEIKRFCILYMIFSQDQLLTHGLMVDIPQRIDTKIINDTTAGSYVLGIV